MNSFVEKFKKMFFSREFIVFVIIGVANTFNGVVFAYIYSNLLNENLAFIFGYMSGLIISYILNSKITFKEELKLIKFVRFALSNIPNFIIQNIVVIVVFNIMGWHKLLAFGLAAAIGMPVTFILIKLFAFNKK